MSKARALILKRIEALSQKVNASRPEVSIDGGRREVAELDLLLWGRKYLPQYYNCESPGAHALLLRDLAGGTVNRNMRDVVIGTRGSAKSFIVSLVYCLACIVHGAEPFILLLSEAAEQANLLLEAIKTELTDNAALAEDYPDACGRGSVWRINKIVTMNGVAVEAAGSGKKLRGRRRGQARPTLVIGDDLEGDGHSASGPKRETSNRRETSSKWFHGTIMKIGDASTNFVVVANAIHRDALAMKLTERPSWRGRFWRSIVKYPDRMDLWAHWQTLYLDPTPEGLARSEQYYADNRAAMDAGAVLLWPARETLLDLMKMRAEDRSSFEAEKQCNPVNPELCEWPDAYFEGLIRFKVWPKGLQVKTIAIDPSKGKDAKRGDYSAIVMLGRDATGRMWVRCNMKRRTTDWIVADAVEAYVQFRPDAAGCESNGFQELLGPDIEQEAERIGQVVYFHPVENVVAKPVRIRRLTKYLSHKLFAFFDDPETQLLIDQLRDFPMGSHDDGPDALEMAVRIAVDVYDAKFVVERPGEGGAFSYDVEG